MSSRFKHFILASAIFGVFAVQAHAATFTLTGLTTLAGMDSNNAINNTATTYTGNLGLGAGVLLELPLTPMTGLEFGLLYSLNRSEVSVLEEKTELEQSLFDLPVLWKLHLSSLQMGLGAYYSAATSPRRTTVSDLSGSSLSPKRYSESGTAFDLGGVAALGFSLNRSVLLEARYYHGFKDINKDTNYSEHRRSVQVLFGYIF